MNYRHNGRVVGSIEPELSVKKDHARETKALGVKCRLEPGLYMFRGDRIKITDVLDYMAFTIIEHESAPGCSSYITYQGDVGEWKRIE
jgi:hypothetical protein